jgi:acyl carrier protein
MSLDANAVLRIVNAHIPAGREAVSNLGVDLYDHGFDSLDVSRLFMAIEDEAGIEFTDTELDEMATVGDIVSVLMRRAAA